MSISVIYISRGRGAGLVSAERFFDGYKKNPPECSHSLYVVAKGWDNIPGLPEVKIIASGLGACTVDLPDDGYDWGAYMRIAADLSSKWLCLLNSHSYPLASGWLGKLHVCAIGEPKFGACGATGSWGTWYFRYPFLERKLSSLLMYPARAGRAYIDHIRRIGAVTAFPNPHLRSNALFISRELFMEFCKLKSVPKNKRDSHLLESGKHGLSNFLSSNGLSIKVVGANGASYTQESWVESKTFRVPTQCNLLIADNQTCAYDLADWERKRRLEYGAWGRVFTPKFE
jgi:hypothetical protein